MRDRGKGLAGPEKLNLQLKGQAEELRHVKRQKNDLKIVVDRQAKEIITLQNSSIRL